MKNQTNKRYHYMGYTISRGNIQRSAGEGIGDDDARRWYINRDSDDFVSYVGTGFSRLFFAKEYIKAHSGRKA